MRKRRNGLTGLWCVAGAALCGGCTSYAVITDPDTGKTYYSMGASPASPYYGRADVTFRDAVTGKRINLDSSEIEYVTEDEFLEATEGRGVYGNR